MQFYQRFLPYVVAIISTTVALFLTLWLEGFLLRTIGAFFYIAIIVATWYGGWRPGSVAVVLSTLALNYFFMPPRFQFWLERPEDVLQLAFFLLVAFLINLLTSNFRDSKQKIERLNQQLARENAELLRMAPSAAQMGMWNWDMVTQKIKWSPDHEQLFGLAPGSFDGKLEAFNACLHPDDREPVNQAIEQAIKNNSLYQQEFRVVWADGSIHWIEGRGHAFYNEAGEPLQLTGTVTAIDQRKQAQGLLQQQIEQQRLVMEMTQRIRRSLNLQEILQTTVDEVRQYLQCDRAIIFEFSPDWRGTVVVESVGEEWISILANEIYDPCLGENYVEPYKQGLITVKSDIYNAGIDPCHQQLLENFQVRANLVVPIAKGEQLWGLLIAHQCDAPRQWQSSEIDLMRQLSSQLSIAIQQAALFKQIQTELSERKQTEGALREREAILRLFAQYTPAGIAMFDRDMRYLIASQRWVDDYGLDGIEPLIGRSHYELFPEIPEAWRQIHQQCMAGATEKCDEELFVREDGTEQWVWWEIHPWYAATNEVGGIIIFSVDITNRKQAEIALRQSEERYRILFESIDEGFCAIEMLFDQNEMPWDYRFLEINPQFEKQTGLQQAVGKTALQLIPNLEEHWFEIYGKVALTGEPLRFEHSSEAMNRWFDLYAFRIGQPSSRKVGVVFKDITDRKLAEMALVQLNAELEQRVQQRTAELTKVNDRLLETLTALQESEESRRLALDLTHIASWDVSLPSGKQIWNDNLFTLLGLAADALEPSYELWRSHVHPDDIGWVEQRYLESLANQTDYTAEYRVVYPNGSVHWLMGRGRAIYDESGQAVRSVGVLLDISDAVAATTQRKQSEEAFRQSEAKFRSLSECSPVGIFMMDIQGQCTYANPRYQTICNCTFDEALGEGWVQFIHPEERNEVTASWLKAVSTGQEYRGEIRYVHKDGTIRFGQVQSAPIFSVVGELSGYVGTVEDVTDSRVVETMKNEFISIVSHELRTPLASIRGSLGLLASGVLKNKPESAQQMLDIAAHDTERLVRLVNDILDLERLESHKVNLVKQWCDAAQIMQQSVATVQSLAAGSNIRLCVESPTLQVWVDSDRIIQTLVNLISNAVKFSPPETTVTLSVQDKADRVLFQVKDQGRGIPSDKLDAIFGRFQQVDASDSRQKGGTGLGLAICKSIVQQHGGKIWVESVVGEGSIFYFTLPKFLD